MKPVFTFTTLTITNGEVLGASECPAYLTSYITTYGNNDPEQVKLLEIFLRDGRGEEVVPDGIYDAFSIEAIKRFQLENINDILAPWGIDYPTGQVYFTTRKKINEMYCNGEKDFPLSPLQIRQIELYRDGVLQPLTDPVGIESSPYPWSARDLPFFSSSGFSTPAAIPSMFGGTFHSLPLITLLRDIFTQIAVGFTTERAHAAEFSL
jgi:hypothetical protein